MNRKIDRVLILIQLLWFTLANLASTQSLAPPKYYLDSIEFAIDKVFIHPESIESIFVNKESTPGEIYIYSKTPPITFLTLNDIIKEYTEYDSISSRMLFYINEKVINEIDSIRVDENYFIYTDVDKALEVNYIEESLKQIIIVKIDLEREKRKPKIILRGENDNLKY
jgi:hypothetical protein